MNMTNFRLEGMSKLDKNIFALSQGANRIAINLETISSNILNSKVVNTVLGQLANFGDGVANASDKVIEKINKAASKSGSGSGSSESLTAGKPRLCRNASISSSEKAGPR